MLLDTPILNKTYDLYKLLCRRRSRIPKSDRYTLWLECEKTVLSILKAIIDTTHQKGEKRTEILYSISNHVDLLKVLVRLAKENQSIDLAHYDEIQRLLQEIGKMIGGWIKFVPAKRV